MERIDLIIQNGVFLTINDKYEIIHGDIAINDGIILNMGPQLNSLYSAKKNINAQKNLVIPGFINTHGHAGMSFFRGYAPSKSVRVWLTQFLFPAELKYVTPEFVYWGTKLACLEMMRGGTTCFVDSYYFEESVAQAALDMNMRAIVGQAIHDKKSPDAQSTQEALMHAEHLIEKWQFHNLVKPAIAPHSAYSCNATTLGKAATLARHYSVPLLMHCAESIKEGIEGLTLFSYLEKLNFLENHLIAAHVITIEESDMRKIKKYNVGIAHCPVSNMKLGSGIAPIQELMNYEISNIGLGTDGPASNNSLDMIAEMKMAVLAQKVKYPEQEFTARQSLYLATRGAASALRMEEYIGSIEIGKRADVTIIDNNNFHQQPVYDFYDMLIYATNVSDVITTIVNGVVLYEDKQFAPFIADQYNEIVAAIKKFKIK